MTFLFWNINKQPLQHLVAKLAREHSVDVLILAECKIGLTDLLEALNGSHKQKYGLIYHNPDKRIIILSLFQRKAFKQLQVEKDERTFAVHALQPPIGEEIILVSAHLLSKLRKSDHEQYTNAVRVACLIRKAEIKAGHTKTLIVGDLNMNPFEPGVMGGNAFHAVMTKDLARQESRQVNGAERLYFYNPMWGLFGDNTPGPPGTYYYYKSGDDLNYFWNTFDQVLLRPQLLPYFRDSDLQVLTKIGTDSLLTKGGRPRKAKVSDHLPVLCRLTI